MHSYAELPLKLLPHQSNSEPETVNITFTTLEPEGLLFFHGQTARERGSGQDYIAIASQYLDRQHNRQMALPVVNSTTEILKQHFQSKKTGLHW